MVVICYKQQKEKLKLKWIIWQNLSKIEPRREQSQISQVFNVRFPFPSNNLGKISIVKLYLIVKH